LWDGSEAATMTMMRWELSDGTVVTSDGETVTVTGDSEVAEELRLELEEPELIDVHEYAQPTVVCLDPSSARNVNAWIAYKIRFNGVLIASAPEFVPVPPEPLDLSDPPTIY
jgi:hypothetical protein